MPIYEYQCESCGHQFEKLQKISDDPVKICPECGNSAVKQLVSAAGFQLRGSGWYVTDFKTDVKKDASSKAKTKREKKAKKEDTKKPKVDTGKSD